MNYKELGKTGLQVPPVIFGTSALGNLYTTLGDDTKQEIVTNCYRNVPVFDSAGKYRAGMALEVLGKCLNSMTIMNHPPELLEFMTELHDRERA